MVSFKVRKANDRGSANHGWLQTKHTFSFANYFDPQYTEFGPLRVLNEDYVKGGRGFGTHQHAEFEIFSYIVSGALEHRDSMTNVEKVGRGFMQFTTAGTGIAHSEMNASATETVHFLQIWAKPAVSRLTPSFSLKYFSDEEKTGNLLPVIAPVGFSDAGGDTVHGIPLERIIRINQDLHMFASILKPNQGAVSVSHTPIGNNRKIYVHVVEDSKSEGVTINDDIVLKPGDGLFVEEAKTHDLLNISSINGKPAEFILLDMVGK
ncbi:hypothetical protein HK096_001287 [Nowakowskiella sp. JEL0078]|nr:hypothetical protein HK096_001287 [Nowakowskiella sp. JEL0078]